MTIHSFRRLCPTGGTSALLCALFVVSSGLSNHAFAGKQSVREVSVAERGEYLTTILGCGGCHTEGALIGNPTGEWLTGSKIGVAYTDDNESPGIVFPANLTSDKKTGLGRWSKKEIVSFLRTGMDHYGKQANTVMPWPNYALLNDADLDAVATYLKQLPAVKNPIPSAIEPGEPIDQTFVRIGVYLFVPESEEEGSPKGE